MSWPWPSSFHIGKDFGPDVNSDDNSSCDIGLFIYVWRSRMCEQRHSSLVCVVGGRRRFHDVVHDVSFIQPEVSFLPPSWMGGLVPLRRICDGVDVGGYVASRLSLDAAPYTLRRGFQVHLPFAGDFFWWSGRLGHSSFSARMLCKCSFCLEALLVSSCSGGGRLGSFVSSGGVRCGVCCVRVFGAFPGGLRCCLPRTPDERRRGWSEMCLFTERVWFRTQKIARLTPFVCCLGDHAEADVGSPRPRAQSKVLSSCQAARLCYFHLGVR